MISTAIKTKTGLLDVGMQIESPAAQFIAESPHAGHSRPAHGQAGTHIRIRPYRNSDSESVRKLFQASMTTADDDSPFSLAMRGQLSSSISLVSYALVIIGLLLLVRSTTVLGQNLGIGVSLIGGSTFILYGTLYRYIVYSKYIGFLRKSLDGDLADIATTYGMESLGEKGTNAGELFYKGKSGFWVAESYGENLEPELVGCVGLDFNTNSDKTSAELRRMVVSSNHRRRGIAQKLVKAVVEHARRNVIKSIYLTTSSYQNPAINMYKKLGWNVEGIRKVSFLLETVHIYKFNLDVSNFQL